MKRLLPVFCVVLICAGFPSYGLIDGVVVKKVLDGAEAGENLLKADAWRPWQEGFERLGNVFVCDNGQDGRVQRGVSQTVILDQVRPEPIVAKAQSKAEGVGGARNSDYALYLDLVYMDGTPLWGQVDMFDVGTGNWDQAKVVIFPEKPVRSVSFHMLLRRHTGRALFRGPELRVIKSPAGASLFDGVPVEHVAGATLGFCIRDVKGDSDFVGIEHQALGIQLTCERQEGTQGAFYDVTLTNTTGQDRAVTLVYTVPV